MPMTLAVRAETIFLYSTHKVGGPLTVALRFSTRVRAIEGTRRRVMRIDILIAAVCTIPMCACTATPSSPTSQATNVTRTTPLILEKNEGERRVWRATPDDPTAGSTAFLLKVDPKNGGSSHLVLGTEDLPPGETIPTHRHPGSDEILFLQTGSARVHLADSVRDVHAGSTVFIPANTWVSVVNIGSDVVSLVFIFSAPGFEDFMREESVREGEKNVPLSKAKDDEIQRKHLGDVIYKAVERAAQYKNTVDGQPYRLWRGLLQHLRPQVLCIG
jgi:quercetin dioxygenase-like cupin family protein